MMTHDYAEGIGLLNVIILLTHLTRSYTILIRNPVGLTHYLESIESKLQDGPFNLLLDTRIF